MKATIITLWVVALSCVTWAIVLAISPNESQAQGTVPLNREAPAAAGDAPRLECDRSTFRFGDRDDSETIEHAFQIRNGGNRDLVISKVEAACGCTVAHVSQTVIPPGQTVSLDAKLSLQGKSGKIYKTIRVLSNDPVNPVYTLSFEGYSKSLVDVDSRYVFFGRIDDDKPRESVVNIRIDPEATFKIIGLRSDSRNLTAQAFAVKHGLHYQVRIQTKGQLPEGNFFGNITVVTDSNRFKEIGIKVQGNVLGEINVTPKKILIESSQTAALTRNLFISPGRVKAFKIISVERPLASLETKITPMANNLYRIQIKNLQAIKALDGKEIRIKTDAPNTKEIRVPIYVVPDKS